MLRRFLLPVTAAAALTGCPPGVGPDPLPEGPAGTQSNVSLIHVNSCDDLSQRVTDAWLETLVQEGFGMYNGGWLEDGVATGDDDDAAPPQSGDRPTDWSETNVQEQGVDEPDLVKTDDGEHLFVVEGGTLYVVDSWPADEAHIVAQLDLSTDEGYPFSMFLKDGRLAVFSEAWGVFSEGSDDYYRYGGGTRATIIDVSDPANPSVLREVNVEGNFTNARMVGDDIYLIVNSYGSMPSSLWDLLYDGTVELPEFDWDASEDDQEAARDAAREILRPYVEQAVAQLDTADLLPRLRDDVGGAVGAEEQLVACTDVYHPQELTSPSTLSVVHIDLGEGDAGSDVSATALMADGWTVYASRENLYVAQGSWWWWWGWGPMDMSTHIHKFELTGDQPQYLASGAVDGWMLNQFSMGEDNGYLRVATTDNDWWWGTEPVTADPANNVFVMRQVGNSLDTVGEIRGIAPNEQIMSARFQGDRGYLVTFEQIDPLFTLDLSNPSAPFIAGELEITGYSSYIHPVGDDHLLTVGMEGDQFGNTTDLAVSLFDVSDFANPTLADRYVVNSDDWSYSEALWDHHAFTLHNDVLAIPAYIYDYSADDFSGMLALSVDTNAGINELGRVSHNDLVSDSECLYDDTYYPGDEWDEDDWGDEDGTSTDPDEDSAGSEGRDEDDPAPPPEEGDGEPGDEPDPSDPYVGGCDDYYWYATMRRSVVIEDNLFSLSDYGIKVNELEAPDNELARIVYRPLP